MATQRVLKQLGVSALAFRPETSEVLLVRRENQPYLSLYSPPGGKVEPGETLREAIIREMREEVGVMFEPFPKFCVAHVNEVSNYVVTCMLGQITGTTERTETLHYEWVRYNEQGHLFTDEDRQIRPSECIPNLGQLVLHGSKVRQIIEDANKGKTQQYTMTTV